MCITFACQCIQPSAHTVAMLHGLLDCMLAGFGMETLTAPIDGGVDASFHGDFALPPAFRDALGAAVKTVQAAAAADAGLKSDW